jgi:hypothetical protein
MSCCPSFIVAIAGPWMCILGCVYLEQIVVQPLTEHIWLGLHLHEGDRLAHMTRVFHSLALSLQELKEEYRGFIGVPREVNSSRFFPYFRHYYNEQGERMDFTYQMSLPSQKPVFKAMSHDGRPIVVKFVRQYNGEAHRLLAAANLAPRLLFDGNDDRNADFPRPGGMRMVVMDFVHGEDLMDYRKRDLPLGSIRDNVKEAIGILHKHDFVFGDLRDPNVRVKLEGDKLVQGMLIDFDWSGKHDEARYPTSMNQDEISWAKGAEKGSVMKKEHDDYMFSKMFPN